MNVPDRRNNSATTPAQQRRNSPNLSDRGLDRRNSCATVLREHDATHHPPLGGCCDALFRKKDRVTKDG